jgi:ATP-dependent DNA helicase RecQ
VWYSSRGRRHGSFFRGNLRLHARRKGAGAPPVREAILRLVQARPDESGIVYCLSRCATEATAHYLRDHGIGARAYHAGLEATARAEAQEAFRRDRVQVIVATVAFGMGIDKPDVRFVIHRDLPGSVESLVPGDWPRRPRRALGRLRGLLLLRGRRRP